MLKEPKQAFDFVPFFVHVFVIFPRINTVFLWWNDSRSSIGLYMLNDYIAIVPLVSQ